MSFKKIYWNIKQADEFPSYKLNEFLERNQRSATSVFPGLEYFIMPENKLGGM